MDRRLRFVRKVDGTAELRISEDARLDMGIDGLANELLDRGYSAADLGRPYLPRRTNIWIIPILREEP